ncbi:MAG: [protein-PII] uridylyltransferase [Gammaproteobacteria bacterium]|nr:[protein-PII] uridylyltransferase [Gammaproteobacteria bacterium]MCP4088844.1 [protein-PII] uridylyltransferase [Gammaproteobacteria bacterium]MCP4274860.1 [protein-PII] uridylyltransferase [Gammaproteobacteria bacterium]MCP4928326.1 [protein-PII] uridylyltransferase [Gammaproteobacteria bacterium]
MSNKTRQDTQDPALTITPEDAALAQRCLTEDGTSLDWEGIDTWLVEIDGADLSEYRQLLKSTREALKQRFLHGDSVELLVRDRATVIDRVIVAAWLHFSNRYNSRIALIAVGGYGRGELHPGSDIDLLLLTGLNARKERSAIAEFLAFLWDIGLEVGHSTRNIAESKSACKNDLTIATTLMESRLLHGPEKLYTKLTKAIEPPAIWPARAFFEAKLIEQQARHLKYDDTAYNLEPNIKGSPGGLRDIQIISWVTRRHFGTGNLSSLVEAGFLTEAQLRILRQGRKFLWQIRFALHILTDRREDRLLFDYQKRIANLFGYEDAAYTLAVEQLMQRYYRTVMDLSRLNEMLLQLFQEAILMNPDAPAKPLNADFEVKNGFLQIAHDHVFPDNPSALLEIFLMLQQHPELKGVSANTIALLRRHLHLIDDAFRQDPRNHRLFLKILAASAGVTHELRRMNLYGVLGQYIPSFGRIVGRMQYDLFHAYTVDAHTLFVVSNLRRFALERFNHEFPRCTEIMATLESPEVIYLAGLFHDIAKGRGGDHSKLGAVSAEAFCLEHGMSRYDSRLVAWLVRHHLTLSLTAQKKDISDPVVIREFAHLIGDEKHLDYLYLLTIADVRATNPQMWNNWKAQLFHETYELSKRALLHGLETPIDKDVLIKEKQQKALLLMQASETTADQARTLWHAFGDDYLLRCRPEEIAWHTKLLADLPDLPEKLTVDVREATSTGGTEVMVHAPQGQFTFAIATGVLDEFGLSIADARIIPLTNQQSLSIYTILERDGEAVEDINRREKIRSRLLSELKVSDKNPILITRKAPRQVRMFTTSTVVSFAKDQTNNRTVMELTSGDRPGLLAETGQVLRDMNIYIQMAKIVTVGERAEDVFYITDDQGKPLSEEIQNKLCHALVSADQSNL